MREGGASTAVQNNAGGFKISNFWKKPSIGNAHNDGNSTTNVIFTENNEQIQNTRIYPGVGFSFYSPDNKYTNVQASANNHEYDVYIKDLGIIASFGRVPRNFQVNGTERFIDEMNKSIATMGNKKMQNDTNIATRDSFADLYPKNEGWVISNAGSMGVTAHNTITGEYGIIQQDGKLALS